MINKPIYSHIAALNELFTRHILTAEECSEVAKRESWEWEDHLTHLLLTKSAAVVQEAIHVLKICGYSVKKELQSELCYSSTVHLISEWLSTISLMHLPFWTTILKFTVVHLCKLDSGTCTNCMHGFHVHLSDYE